MNKILLEYLQSTSGTLSLTQIIVSFAVSLFIGFLIYLSYRLSHSSQVYSPRFNASLVMLTVITTMVMCVIGNNIALSLGMVGALSIVRFRTAIKDPRDTTYIFWCIAVGICCGVSEFHVPVIGSAALFAILLCFGTIHSNDRFLLVIHSSEEAGREVEQLINNLYSGKALLRVKNAGKGNLELIYELTQTIINMVPAQNLVDEQLMKVDGVRQVNLIMQSEEVSR